MLKRIALALALSLPLGACVTVDLPRLISDVTQPVSINTEYEVEAAVYTLRRAAYGYFDLRQCRRTEVESIQNPCSRYSTKLKIQVADGKLSVELAKFRANPTVFTGINSAISGFRKVLTDNGVN